MKFPAYLTVLPLLAVLVFLGGCATITPYAGPRTNNSTTLIVSATGLNKHAMLQDDALWVHLFENNGTVGRGTVLLTPDAPQQTILVDRDVPLVLRYMSVEPHFGGYTYCNRDVPFTATDSVEHHAVYATTKYACSIQISKSGANGEKQVLSELDGVFGGIQYEAKVVP